MAWLEKSTGAGNRSRAVGMVQGRGRGRSAIEEKREWSGSGDWRGQLGGARGVGHRREKRWKVVALSLASCLAGGQAGCAAC